ncbi:MAG: hypothetical protein J3Q66DRAFT_419172 [Benniella sp.]|nr:MAG: hypothetical protein J3Q66DRAFT_419172 [Benniella sp.]
MAIICDDHTTPMDCTLGIGLAVSLKLVNNNRLELGSIRALTCSADVLVATLNDDTDIGELKLDLVVLVAPEAHATLLDMDNEFYRRRFGYEKEVVLGEPVVLWGGLYKKTSPNTPEFPALIRTGTTGFEQEGQYVLRWRVKVQKGYHITSGVRFQVSVSYSAEEDVTGSLDIVYPHEEYNKLGRNHHTGEYQDLELEDLVVVQPYENSSKFERQWATVEVSMSNWPNSEGHTTITDFKSNTWN